LTAEEKKIPKSWHNSGFLSPADSGVSEAAENSTDSQKRIPVHKKYIKKYMLNTVAMWTAEGEVMETRCL